MLATGQDFIELGQDAYEKNYQERLLRNLTRKATRLGYSLVPAQSTSGECQDRLSRKRLVMLPDLDREILFLFASD